MELITSRQNALCTHLRKLATDGAYRRKNGEFLCDSPKLLAEALLHGGDVRCVVSTDGAPCPSLPDTVRQVQVPRDVMASLSPAQTPQGVLAVCGMRDKPLPPRFTGRRYVVLDGVQDPGNVGGILRTADALGADGLLLVNACADLYNPKTIRATMGAVFRCPVWVCDVAALAALLQASELPLYGAALQADTVDVRQVAYTRAAIAIGSEGKGLSTALLAICDKTVKIPMCAHCESLNAAVAATVLLWEAARGDGT